MFTRFDFHGLSWIESNILFVMLFFACSYWHKSKYFQGRILWNLDPDHGPHPINFED